jgi:hypothetical protein
MNKRVRDMYIIVLGRKPSTKILRIDTLPQDWMGIVYEDHSVFAVPPFTDEEGSPITIAVNEELTDDLCACGDCFGSRPDK